jgi:hypothetical protein
LLARKKQEREKLSIAIARLRSMRAQSFEFDSIARRRIAGEDRRDSRSVLFAQRRVFDAAA